MSEPNTYQSGLLEQKSSFEGMNLTESLAKRQKAISNSVSEFTTQMVNPIKSTVSKIKEGVALIKDMDRKLSDQLYQYKSETIDNINGYLNALTGGKLNIEDFGNVLSYQDGFKVDSDELLRIAGKTMGFNLNSIGNMKQQLGQAFIDELNDLTLGLSDGLFIVGYDGEINISGDWDRNKGEFIFDFLSKGSDTFSAVNNFAASNAILNTLIYNNAEIGFVQGFRPFEEMYLYQSDYYNALINSIEILIGRGDILSLKEVLTILDEEERWKVKAKYPNFAETVLRNFSFDYNTTEDQYDELKDTLLEIIIKVEGKDWNKEETFMGSLLNIGLVNHISDDSKTLLQRDESLVPFLLASGIFNERNAMDAFRSDFSNAVLF